MGLTIGASGSQIALLSNNQKNSRGIQQATERLATGLRINSGRDDPAGLIAAEQIQGDIVDIQAQQRVLSAQQGKVQVQQSGRQLATGVIHEIRGHLVETAGTFSSSEQRQATQQQIDAALDALDRIESTTGISLPAELQDLRSGGSANIVENDPATAQALVDEQLSTINQASAAAGAYQRYTLDVDQRLAEDQAVVAAESYSRIADTDYAKETTNLIKAKILNEASLKTIALAQNLKKEGILLLFDTL